MKKTNKNNFKDINKNEYEEGIEETNSLFILQALNTGNAILLNSPGMRIIKTAISILVCLVLDFLRNSANYVDSSIAAIVSLGTSTRMTWKAGLSRILGTFVAGLYASLFIHFVVENMEMNTKSLSYLILVAFMVIPLLTLLSHFKQNSTICVAAIVFLLICLNPESSSKPFIYALKSSFDTLIGVVVAVIINWFPPLNKIGDHYDKQRRLAYINAKAIQNRIEEIEQERKEQKIMDEESDEKSDDKDTNLREKKNI